MYKTFGLKDLVSFKSGFLKHLAVLIKKERCSTLKDFLKSIFREGDGVYYWEGTSLKFKIAKNKEDGLEFVDEKEKIRLIITKDDISSLWTLVKPILIGKKSADSNGAKTIEKILLEKFGEGYFENTLDKPYLIYDIETSMGHNDNMASFKFYLAYSMELEGNKMKYDYIDQDSLEKFVDKLVNYDGYIVGFNSIAFDNPVSVLNLGGSQEQIDIINSKSIDLYLFIKNLTKKRMGLNKLSEVLIGIKKTLESGAEGSSLFEQYKKSGDESLLEEFKKYCKNDVRMTALLFLYLLYFKKIHIDDKEYIYSVEDFMRLSKLIDSKASSIDDSSAIEKRLLD